MLECRADKKDIYLPQLAKVEQTKLLNETELYLRLTMEQGQLGQQPGQFVEVSLAGIGEAPITIASSPTLKDGFELVVRRIGNVTNAIHRLKAGDRIGIRGPFGSGYPVEEAKGKNLVFISGGIGLVPQRSFINYVLDKRNEYGELTVLLGTKSPSQRFLHSELAGWAQRNDMRFMETVDEADENWKGNVGVVTKLIDMIAGELSSSLVFVCGPPIMYKFVLLALSDANVPKEAIYLNLERRMKCGVGKCGHCQVNDLYVCMSGPVFRYLDLAGVPEAI